MHVDLDSGGKRHGGAVVRNLTKRDKICLNRCQKNNSGQSTLHCIGGSAVCIRAHTSPQTTAATTTMRRDDQPRLTRWDLQQNIFLFFIISNVRMARGPKRLLPGHQGTLAAASGPWLALCNNFSLHSQQLAQHNGTKKPSVKL